MGSRMIIVVGDLVSGGGKVISGSSFTDIDGLPVARIGDNASCQRCGGIFPIVSGDPTFVVDGQPVARHADSLACGCKLLSVRQHRVFLDALTGEQTVSRRPAPIEATTRLVDLAEDHDEAFVIVSGFTAEPIANRPYRIIRHDGGIETGTTDQNGRTHLVCSASPEHLVVELAEETLA